MFKFNCLSVFFISYFVLQFTAAEVDVSFITKCKAEDEACLVSSAQAAVQYLAPGIPALKVKTADPLVLDEVDSDSANLKLKFLNIKVMGIGKSVITSLKRDTDKQSYKISLEMPIILTGQYDLSGKILILEAFGNGNIEAHSDKLVCNIEVKYEINEKNGKKHWKITTVDYTYEFVEKLYIKLDNLFGGDERLAGPINQLLDASWKEIAVDVAGPLVKKVIFEVVNIVKTFFLMVPTDMLEIQ